MKPPFKRYQAVSVLGKPGKFLNYTDHDYLGARVSVVSGGSRFWAVVPLEWVEGVDQ